MSNNQNLHIYEGMIIESFYKMKTIENKFTTKRSAIAESIISAGIKTINAAKKGRTPKGNVVDIARVAGVMAVKRTSDLIPYCHPILIDHAEISFEFEGNKIVVTCRVTSIAKTGVEMEALTGASIAALTVYDMLKPIDKNIEIIKTRLIEKRGGKSDFTGNVKNKKAAILIPSDTAFKSPKKDLTGKYIFNELSKFGFKTLKPKIIPNDEALIEGTLINWVDKKIDLIITTGGTGVGPRDKTASATKNVIDFELTGISEALRHHGVERTPFAALSMATAGLKGKTIIINLPGSINAVKDYMGLIIPIARHGFDMLSGKRH